MHSKAVLHLWQAAVALAAAFALVLVALSFINAPRLLVAGRQGHLGYTADAASYHGVAAHRIVYFEPESPLPSAGVLVGDLLVDPPRGTFLAGEEITLRVVHAAVPRTVQVAAVPIARLYAPVKTVIDLFLDAFILALGLLIALRRSRDPSALALALGFCLSALPLFVYSLPVHPFNGVINFAISWLGVLFLPLTSYFVVCFEGGYRSALRPWLLRAIAVFSAVYVSCLLALAPYYLGRVWIAPAPLIQLCTVLMGLGVLLCFVSLLDTWRHVDGERRAKLRWFMVGVAVGLANLAVVVLDSFSVFGVSGSTELRVAILEDVLIAAAALALSYSILRERVVDLGFAVSRALVFAVFTAILLVCFGIVEWLADHVIRFQQRESSALLDGAIAVGLYLSFHRVWDWIKHWVERVFFRRWHLREAALSRFLEKAPRFVDPDALAKALLEAIDAFTGSRGSALYRLGEARLGEAGGFAREYATLAEFPASFAPDADLIVEMKTFREPVHLLKGPAAHAAALALPMMRRAELECFVLVGRKIAREGFRPDEVELLSRATREVGFDLSMLRVDDLERRAQDLQQRNSALSEELQVLARSRL